jgi:hypothetical protein
LPVEFIAKSAHQRFSGNTRTGDFSLVIISVAVTAIYCEGQRLIRRGTDVARTASDRLRFWNKDCAVALPQRAEGTSQTARDGAGLPVG